MVCKLSTVSVNHAKPNQWPPVHVSKGDSVGPMLVIFLIEWMRGKRLVSIGWFYSFGLSFGFNINVNIKLFSNVYLLHLGLELTRPLSGKSGLSTTHTQKRQIFRSLIMLAFRIWQTVMHGERLKLSNLKMKF